MSVTRRSFLAALSTWPFSPSGDALHVYPDGFPAYVDLAARGSALLLHLGLDYLVECPTFVDGRKIGVSRTEGRPAFCYVGSSPIGERFSSWRHREVATSESVTPDARNLYALHSRRDANIPDTFVVLDAHDGEVVRSVRLSRAQRNRISERRPAEFSDVTYRVALESPLRPWMPVRCGGAFSPQPQGLWLREFFSGATPWARADQSRRELAINELERVATYPEVYEWLCPEYVAFLRGWAEYSAPLPACSPPFQRLKRIEWFDERYGYQIDEDDRIYRLELKDGELISTRIDSMPGTSR